MSQPVNFKELLELQLILDHETTKKRKNGFNPRERTEIDIKLALEYSFCFQVLKLYSDGNSFNHS